MTALTDEQRNRVEKLAHEFTANRDTYLRLVSFGNAALSDPLLMSAVRAEEREKCALLCQITYGNLACAAAIRALGDKE